MQTNIFSALLLTIALAAPGAAQSVTSSDIQRLQDEVYQAGGEVSRLRTTNPTEASRLQDDLDGLREEVIYLKVKLRKENSVERRDYTDVRDRLQQLRSRARGDNAAAPTSTSGRTPDRDRDVVFDDRPRTSSPSSTSTPPSTSSDRSAIPVGTEIDVRLQTELTSDTAQVEDRFEGTTVADLYQGERVLIPAGSLVRGIVTSVNRASRTDRKGSLTVSFNQVTV
jgi:hypothetical protein